MLWVAPAGIQPDIPLRATHAVATIVAEIAALPLRSMVDAAVVAIRAEHRSGNSRTARCGSQKCRRSGRSSSRRRLVPTRRHSPATASMPWPLAGLVEAASGDLPVLLASFRQPAVELAGRLFGRRLQDSAVSSGCCCRLLGRSMTTVQPAPAFLAAGPVSPSVSADLAAAPSSLCPSDASR